MLERSPNRFGAMRRLLSAVLLTTMLGCMIGREEPEPIDPMEQEPTIKLTGVIVGVVGLGVLMQNHSSEELKHVRVIVNEGSPDGEYRFEIGSILENSPRNFLARSFRREDGTSLDPQTVEILSMTVYASTSKGRGSWRGSYPSRNRSR